MSDATINKIVGQHEVFNALRDVIAASDPAKRELLAQTMDAYAEDFPEEYDWATGAQAPMRLYGLMMEIELACRPETDDTAPDYSEVAKQLDAYLRYRAGKEGVPYEMRPAFFHKHSEEALAECFGVTIDNGRLSADNQRPELLAEWKSMQDEDGNV
jgi:hypothetical protein